MANSFYTIVYKDKTMFIKMKDVYPECEFYIRSNPKLHPFICLKEDNSCHVGMNCMMILAKRVNYIFEQFSDVHLLFLYFSYPDKPGSQRAAAFWRPEFDRDPKYLTFNRSAWENIKSKGMIFKWSLPDSLFLGK